MRYFIGNWKMFGVPKSINILNKINLFHSKKPELLKIFKSKIKVIFASGGIVENSKKQILFIHRKGKWDLPKGKAENKETIDQTALREVEEETGVKRLSITKPLEITYHIFKRNDKYFIKKTYWFEMFSPYTGDLKPQKNEGITKVKWVSPKKLIKVRKNIYANIEALI